MRSTSLCSLWFRAPLTAFGIAALGASTVLSGAADAADDGDSAASQPHRADDQTSDDTSVTDDDAPSSQPARAPSSMPAPAERDGPSSQPSSLPATTVTDDADQMSDDTDASFDDVDGIGDDEGEFNDDGFAAGFFPTSRSIPRLFGDTVSAGGFTSRPGASEASAVLPRGAGLLAIGMAVEGVLTSDLLAESQRLVAPELVLRYGVFDGVEIRTTAIGAVEASSSTTAVRAGFSALSFGTSVQILDGDGMFIPQLAMLADLSVPITTLSVDDIGAHGRLMASWGFLERLTLAGNLGAGYDGASDEFYFPYTTQIAFNVGGGLGVYAESFGSVTLTALPTVWVDAGIFYDVGSLVRLDLATGLLPLGQERAWFIAVGASVLLPGHLWLSDDDA